MYAETSLLFCIMGAGLVGLAVVASLMAKIRSIRVDHQGAAHIAAAIRAGAMTFLKEEYKIIAFVVAFIAVLLGYFATPLAAGCFVTGSLLSLLTGFIGMVAATDANVRTTLAAKKSGERAAFMVAFFGGGVMGFSVASMGLLGLGALLYLFLEHSNLPTKSAPTSADLV